MTLQEAWHELFDDWEEFCLDPDNFQKRDQQMEIEFCQRQRAGLPVLLPKIPRLAIIDTGLCCGVRCGAGICPPLGDVLMGIFGTGKAILHMTFPNGQQNTVTLSSQPSRVLTGNFFPTLARDPISYHYIVIDNDARHQWIFGVICEKHREELWSSAIFSNSIKLSLPTFLPRLYPLVPSTRVMRITDVSGWMRERMDIKKRQQSLFLKELMEKACHPSRIQNIGID